jgi:RNA polymerase sigma-70 factor (ECF subfamily)
MAAVQCPACLAEEQGIRGQIAFDPGPYLSAMRAAARRVLRSPDLVEDAVQDALARQWRLHPGPLPDVAVLARLATLSALAILRSQARRERRERSACSSRAHQDCCPPDQGPEWIAMELESGHQIQAALASLPLRLREPLVLYALEGHDYACIAETLGWPIGTVRSRIFRARAQLRRLLSPGGPWPEEMLGEREPRACERH